MATVLDYLKEYRDISFREMPMTEVDSLALCQLSYLKFDGLVPEVHENLPSVTLATLKRTRNLTNCLRMYAMRRSTGHWWMPCFPEKDTGI